MNHFFKSDNDHLFFAVGRVVNVIVRPALLYFIIQFSDEVAANLIAGSFLAVAIGMALSNADLHRKFYQERFATGHTNPVVLSNYLVGSCCVIATISAVIFLYASLATNSIFFAALTASFFITEKIFDEIQRIALFAKAFFWLGGLFIVRAICCVGLFVFLVATDFPEETLVSSFVFGNIFAAFICLHKSPWRALLHSVLINFNLRCALMDIQHNIELWLMRSCSNVYTHIDRILISTIFPSFLATYTLCAMVFSIIPLTFDLFYFSKLRQEFLKGTKTIVATLQDFKFWFWLIFPIALSCGVTFSLAFLDPMRSLLALFLEVLRSLYPLSTPYMLFRVNCYIGENKNAFFWWLTQHFLLY